MTTFDELYRLNVNDKTEKKNELTYLSWANAWALFIKAYPDATYEVWKDENNRPYIYDPDLGYMVFTTITANGQTREMWLPVMDGSNKAMKAQPYTYSVYNRYKKTYEEKTCAAASMFDVNKTIMRCLTKCMAMYGLGLYIFEGEDLPESTEEAEAAADVKQPAQARKTPQKATQSATKAPKAETVTPEQAAELIKLAEQYTGQTKDVDKWLCRQIKINGEPLKSINDCPIENYEATRDLLAAEVERKANESRKAEA